MSWICELCIHSFYFILTGFHICLFSVVENKYIAYKHVGNNTHPGYAYVFANIVASLPVAMMDSLLFCTILYWMSGYVWVKGGLGT